MRVFRREQRFVAAIGSRSPTHKRVKVGRVGEPGVARGSLLEESTRDFQLGFAKSASFTPGLSEKQMAVFKLDVYCRN